MNGTASVTRVAYISLIFVILASFWSLGKVTSQTDSHSLSPQHLAAANNGWVIGCVDCPKVFSQITEHSLRLDKSGLPHIAYGERNLYYAWHDGNSWQYEIVDNTDHVGLHASLALDLNDYGRISYYDSVNKDLRYAYQTSSGWHLEIVDSVGEVGRFSSLALGQSGWPHIAYALGSPEYDLKYAYRDVSGWHIETVDSAGKIYTGYPDNIISLSLDRNGNPRIAYIEFDAKLLRYAYRDNDGWHTEDVFSGLSYSTELSLSIDQDGYPGIAFRSNGLSYAFKDENGWHFENPVTTYAREISLSMDSDGHAYISYILQSGDDVLSYIFRDGSGWHEPQAIDTEEASISGSSLALGQDESVYIIYLPPDELRYTYKSGDSWVKETVDRELTITGWTSLELDKNGYAHITYQASSDLKYAYQDSLGWSSWTFISSHDIGSNNSLSLDKNGYPHISFFDATWKFLLYASWDGSDWHESVVDGLNLPPPLDPLLAGSTSSIADGNGVPCISYYYITDEELRFACHMGDDWDKITVDSTGAVGPHSSLAFNAANIPHISYIDRTNSDLKYAYYVGLGGNCGSSTWQCYTVDNIGEVGEYTSIALDVYGYPHISYYDETNSALKYAYLDANGWHLDTIDNDGEVGECTSLAVDADGYAHISYSDMGNEDLKYAYQDSDGWHVETVDSFGDVGMSTSLALDQNGHPYISYRAENFSALKLAYFTDFPPAPTPVPTPLPTPPTGGIWVYLPVIRK